MSYIQFKSYRNFYLHTDGWGVAQLNDIVVLLENVIKHFYSNLYRRRILSKQVFIKNSSNTIPPTNYPQIIKGRYYNTIYLSVKDRLWSKFSYQFSHELCHHIIDSNFYITNGKYGWFEETLCELASIYSIDSMSQTWQTEPHYPNWKDYSSSLKDYVNEIMGRTEYVISTPFNEWLEENLNELYKDRYKRTENAIIALRLLPLFKNDTKLWETIQFLKFVNVTESMDFKSFLENWKKSVPNKLRKKIILIESTLLNNH